MIDLLPFSAVLVFVATLTRVPKDTTRSKIYGAFLLIASLTIEFIVFRSSLSPLEKYAYYAGVDSTLFFLVLQNFDDQDFF